MPAPIRPSQDRISPWTAQTVGMSYDILDRMERAVAKVRERLLRATACSIFRPERPVLSAQAEGLGDGSILVLAL